MVYFLGRLFVADALWAYEAKIKTTEAPKIRRGGRVVEGARLESV